MAIRQFHRQCQSLQLNFISPRQHSLYA